MQVVIHTLTHTTYTYTEKIKEHKVRKALQQKLDNNIKA